MRFFVAVEDVSSFTNTSHELLFCLYWFFEWHSALLMLVEIGLTLESLFEFPKEYLPTKLCCSDRNAVVASYSGR
jgi:hypothetical protein